MFDSTNAQFGKPINHIRFCVLFHPTIHITHGYSKYAVYRSKWCDRICISLTSIQSNGIKNKEYTRLRRKLLAFWSRMRWKLLEVHKFQTLISTNWLIDSGKFQSVSNEYILFNLCITLSELNGISCVPPASDVQGEHFKM